MRLGHGEGANQCAQHLLFIDRGKRKTGGSLRITERNADVVPFPDGLESEIAFTRCPETFLRGGELELAFFA